MIAAILLAGALLIHGLLAVTGNGSWTDVLMDAIGLATLGMGTRAMALARLGRSATLTRAGATAGRNAAARTLSQASFNGGRGIIGGTHKFLLQTFSGTTGRRGLGGSLTLEPSLWLIGRRPTGLPTSAPGAVDALCATFEISPEQEHERGVVEAVLGSTVHASTRHRCPCSCCGGPRSPRRPSRSSSAHGA